MVATNNPPNVVRLATQQQLASFRNALSSEMNMRPLTTEERKLVAGFASKLEEAERIQLLKDLRNSSAIPARSDGSRVMFEIAGYKRPMYRGQHPFGVEGWMLDSDGVEVSVLLHVDENGRLLELELIRWDSKDLLGPRWETLRLQ
ncbi:DUF6984 family protein [Cupriavidus pauculus]|uniref:DUF6984 family protein n=1 Tax=Cupriavidus pauculus TaxID=82633 RepID=UPI000F5A276C